MQVGVELIGPNRSGAPIREMQRKVGGRARGGTEARTDASIRWRKWNKRRWIGIRILRSRKLSSKGTEISLLETRLRMEMAPLNYKIDKKEERN